MSTYINNVHDGLHGIRSVAQDLAVLSRAFFATGNDHVSTELSDMASELLKHSSAISDAVSNELSKQTRELERSIGQTLSAIVERSDDA